MSISYDGMLTFLFSSSGLFNLLYKKNSVLGKPSVVFTHANVMPLYVACQLGLSYLFKAVHLVNFLTVHFKIVKDSGI